MQKCLVIVGILWVCLFACTNDQASPLRETPYDLGLPAHFPVMDIPTDNALTEERVALGELLFFDPILSRDSTVSCGSCHLPALAFADGKRVSEGVDGREGMRNAPSLWNVGYEEAFFRDGGARTLELQVLTPISDPNEMDVSMEEVVKRLQAHPAYPFLFQQAYGRTADRFGVIRAIAAYERTLISGNSAYDRFVYGGDSSALSLLAQQGMQLFFGDRLKCGNCHSGFNLTNNGFANIGLYEQYADVGRKRVTLLEEDAGKFKVPSLRNVGLTAPYMHDGSLGTLEEVLSHYASGGKGHVNQATAIRGFTLNEEEMRAVIAFLGSLTE